MTSDEWRENYGTNVQPGPKTIDWNWNPHCSLSVARKWGGLKAVRGVLLARIQKALDEI